MSHFLRRAALWLALVPGLVPALRAQTLDPAFHVPEIYTEAGVTAAALMPNGQLVVAGDFVRANGQPSNKLARLDAAGVADAAFGQNLSGAILTALSKLTPLPNGQLLVTGNYQAGAVERKYLFRLNADGTLDAAFSAMPAISYAAPVLKDVVVQPDGRVLVLGTYLTGSGNNPELLRLLSNGAPDPSFSVALQAEQRLQLQLQADGKILLGGVIRQVNGLARSNVTRLNADGSTDASYQPAVNMVVTALALDASGAALVGGQTSVTGQPQSIVRLLSNGTLDASFAFPTALAGRDCKQLAVQANGQILVLTEGISQATSMPYPFSSQLTRLLLTGAVDASFQPGSGPDGAIANIQVSPTNQLLVTGSFNNFSGERRTVALLQPNGALNSSFAPLLQVPGQVTAVRRLSDGRLVIAGQFNSIDGQLTDRLARLLPNGQPDPAFVRREPRSAQNTPPRIAMQADGKLLVAYTIKLFEYNVAGVTYDVVFNRLNLDGTVDTGFVPAVTQDNTLGSGILLLAEQSPGHIIVGGSFVDAAGKRNLTRLTATGAIDAGFTPPANQPNVYAGSIVQATGALLCLGPGAAQNTTTLVRLMANGTPDAGFAYAPSVPALGQERIAEIPGTNEFLFARYLGPSSPNVLERIAANGTPVAGFASPYTSIFTPAFSLTGVRALAAQADGRILVGGFMQQGTATTYPLERLNTNGQLDGTFNRSIIPAAPSVLSFSITQKYYVNDLLVQPDGAIVVAGNFPAAGGQAVTGLVRLLPAGVLAVG
ncbi:hypothetical protein, partial [Hymenobacter agri]